MTTIEQEYERVGDELQLYIDEWMAWYQMRSRQLHSEVIGQARALLGENRAYELGVLMALDCCRSIDRLFSPLCNSTGAARLDDEQREADEQIMHVFMALDTETRLDMKTQHASSMRTCLAHRTKQQSYCRREFVEYIGSVAADFRAANTQLVSARPGFGATRTHLRCMLEKLCDKRVELASRLTPSPASHEEPR